MQLPVPYRLWATIGLSSGKHHHGISSRDISPYIAVSTCKDHGTAINFVVQLSINFVVQLSINFVVQLSINFVTQLSIHFVV